MLDEKRKQHFVLSDKLITSFLFIQSMWMKKKILEINSLCRKLTHKSKSIQLSTILLNQQIWKALLGLSMVFHQGKSQPIRPNSQIPKVTLAPVVKSHQPKSCFLVKPNSILTRP